MKWAVKKKQCKTKKSLGITEKKRTRDSTHKNDDTWIIAYGKSYQHISPNKGRTANY